VASSGYWGFPAVKLWRKRHEKQHWPFGVGFGWFWGWVGLGSVEFIGRLFSLLPLFLFLVVTLFPLYPLLSSLPCIILSLSLKLHQGSLFARSLQNAGHSSSPNSRLQASPARCCSPRCRFLRMRSPPQFARIRYNLVRALHEHSLTFLIQNRCYSTSGERVAKYNGTKDSNVRFALSHNTAFRRC